MPLISGNNALTHFSHPLAVSKLEARFSIQQKTERFRLEFDSPQSDSLELGQVVVLNQTNDGLVPYGTTNSSSFKLGVLVELSYGRTVAFIKPFNKIITDFVNPRILDGQAGDTYYISDSGTINTSSDGTELYYQITNPVSTVVEATALDVQMTDSDSLLVNGVLCSSGQRSVENIKDDIELQKGLHGVTATAPVPDTALKSFDAQAPNFDAFLAVSNDSGTTYVNPSFTISDGIQSTTVTIQGSSVTTKPHPDEPNYLTVDATEMMSIINSAMLSESVPVTASTFSHSSGNNSTFYPGLKLTLNPESTGTALTITQVTNDVTNRSFAQSFGLPTTVQRITGKRLTLTRADGGDILLTGTGLFVNNNGMVSSSSGRPPILLMAGSSGAQGPQGPVGPQGNAGLDADNTSIATTLSVDPTFVSNVSASSTLQTALTQSLKNDSAFVDATKGDQGERGIQGVQGPQGSAGTGITFKGTKESYAKLIEEEASNAAQGDAWLVQTVNGSTSDSLWIHDGTNFVDGGSIQGPQGIQGPIGPEGPQGPIGLTGQDADNSEVATNLAADSSFVASVAQSSTLSSNIATTLAGTSSFLESVEGPEGPVGPAGPKGDQGIPGTDGTDGATGSQGLSAYQVWEAMSGNSGKSQEEYIDAITGPAGQDANNNDIAATLSATNTFVASVAASSTLSGNIAIDLADDDVFKAAVKGEQGEKGNQGDPGINGTQGIQGEKGDQGNSITGVTLNSQHQLVNSIENTPDQTTTSVRGPQGEKGDQGNSLTSIALNENYELEIDIEGQTTTTTASVRGPQGLQGAQGNKGDKGEKGDQGIQGETGPQGNQGPQGSTGTGIIFKGSVSTNPSGNGQVDASSETFTPEQGDAVLNSTSDELFIFDGTDWVGGGSIQGPPGAQGSTGAKGDKGDKGDTGATGQDGSDLTVTQVTNNSDNTITITFSDGTVHTTASLKGDTGSQGPKGDTGETGAAGADADSYIEDSSTATDKLWSSSKIFTELSDKADASDIPDVSSFITGYNVSKEDVTAHQAELIITESQITADFSKYQAADSNIVSDANYVATDNNYTDDEKSKLFGIQAGAKDDQTAEEIVGLINTDTTAKGTLKTALGITGTLGTAAYTAISDYATAAQGANADSALQSGDNISELNNNAGYLTVHPTINAATENLTNSGRTYIQSIGLDSNGHVTSVSTATDTDTTYSAASGGGLSVSDEKFSIDNSVTAATLNNPAKTVNLSFNAKGLITSAALQDIQIEKSQVTDLAFGTSDTNAVKIDSDEIDAGEYARFTADGLESLTSAEVKTDLSLNHVENTALSTWPGSLNITTLGTVASGTWEGTSIADSYIASANTWNTAATDLGNKANLTTETKTDLVSAINELETNNNSTQSSLDDLLDDVGTATLATSAQTITGAINELDGEINTVEASIGLTTAGAYQVRSGSNYIDSLSSVVAEATALDTQVKANADNIALLEIRDGGLFEEDASSVYYPSKIKISGHLGPFRIDLDQIITNNGCGHIIFFGTGSKRHEDRHFKVLKDGNCNHTIFTGTTL